MASLRGEMRIPQEDLWTKSIDWFAVDDDGQIACLSNRLYGAVPEVVLSSKHNYDLLGELLDFPPIGEPIACQDVLAQISRLKGFDEERARQGYMRWDGAIAASGIYSYTADDWSGRWKGSPPNGYALVARPQVPLKLHELRPELREALALMRFRGLRFRDAVYIGPDEVMRV